MNRFCFKNKVFSPFAEIDDFASSFQLDMQWKIVYQMRYNSFEHLSISAPFTQSLVKTYHALLEILEDLGIFRLLL